jgi:aminomethyltransferase
MADFGGWEMPIEYPTGVLAEHAAVRSAAGAFDVSHMGKLVVEGDGAAAALNALLVNDLDRIGPGQAQYSMLCSDSGGVEDDLIVYRMSDRAVRIVPNAANAALVREALAGGLPPGIEVEDRHEDEGILAIQGPASPGVLTSVGLPGADLPYMAFVEASLAGTPVLVCRTGYTGEVGYEVIAPVEVVPALWEAVTEAGAVPCGLGARDTLRTEMGYPLHGQDLSATITPLEAGLAWAVGWDKPAFWGRQALLDQRAAGRPRALRGLRVQGRGVPRAGMLVRSQGPVVGHVTSGTFSPTLKVGIALALLDPAVALGDEALIDVRGRAVAAQVVRPPFVGSSPR